MYVTPGAEQHPMHQPADINCALRRITNQTVYYLYSMDPVSRETVWTQNFLKAHQFLNENEAMEFAERFLGERAEECDTFSEYETWTI